MRKSIRVAVFAVGAFLGSQAFARGGHGGGHGRGHGGGHAGGGHGSGHAGGGHLGGPHFSGGHGRGHFGSHPGNHWGRRGQAAVHGPRFARGMYRRGYYGAWYGSPFVWLPGAWNWTGVRYVWSDGNWAMPPQRGQVWVPGQWFGVSEAGAWQPGQWVAPPRPEDDEVECDDASAPCPRQQDEDHRDEPAASQDDSREPQPAPPQVPGAP